MDYSIIYVLGSIVIAIGLIAGIKYLRNKKLIETEDLNFVVQVLNISLQIANELKLTQEPQIKQITELVIQSLDYITKNMTIEQNQNLTSEQVNDAILKNAQEYCFELCTKTNIEITDDRKIIITELLQLAIENKYTATIAKLTPPVQDMKTINDNTIPNPNEISDEN